MAALYRSFRVWGQVKALRLLHPLPLTQCGCAQPRCHARARHLTSLCLHLSSIDTWPEAICVRPSGCSQCHWRHAPRIYHDVLFCNCSSIARPKNFCPPSLLALGSSPSPRRPRCAVGGESIFLLICAFFPASFARLWAHQDGKPRLFVFSPVCRAWSTVPRTQELRSK